MSEQLKIWWIPQIPGPSFEAPVANLDEAKLLLRTLAAYDAFQFDNNIKPDYCNAGGLLHFVDGDWIDWENEDGDSIDDLMQEEACEPQS
jgi:Superinfection exclusion gene product 17